MTAGSARPNAAPVASLFALYLGALACTRVGNLVTRLGERGGWLPDWGRLLAAVAAALPLIVAAVLFWRLLRRNLDTPALLVAIGVAIAARRYA